MKIYLMLIFLLPAMIFAQTAVGAWTFDDAQDLLNATVGNDLTLVGTHTAVAGPSGLDGAVNIGVGSHYRVNHGIAANGGGTMVNEYSLVIDFKIPSLGQWYTFFQTAYQNNNDGEAFINTSGNIGVAATGYSSYTVLPGEWYRLVIAIDLGSTYRYYLEGQLLKEGNNQTVDGRFAIYPANATQPLLLFADENAEDNPINIAQATIYNGCLSATQVAALGGFGHSIVPPTAEMLPYLQTPTPTSMYVCWHAASGDESRVEYGTTAALGLSQTGTVYSFDASTKWHKVKLENLLPDTEYFYQCHTGTQVSVPKAFRTPPAVGLREGNFRFIIVGDSQSNSGVSTSIVNRITQKLTELYGADWHNDVRLLCHVGDAIANGTNLASYATEHFIPFGQLSGSLPIMEAIGNHEMESPYYYQYRCYEDFAGTEGEKYYSFDVGTMRFIFLNPNIATATETTWLQNQVAAAEANPNLEWIFSFSHMPAYSEIWPDGNHSWAQNTLLPTLSAADKAAILAGGHSHNYERGFTPTGNLTTLICGGAGGSLDRWGMYNNQQDYPNTIKALDQYHWVLVDVDMETLSYSATMYSMGHPDLPRINEIMDSWHVDGAAENPFFPIAVSQSATATSPLRLIATQAYHQPPVLSTRFQLANTAAFTSPLVDAIRHQTNIYGDSDAPLWLPTDLNAGLDIWRYPVSDGLLQLGSTYYWRMQSRDANLNWSNWSEPREFVYTLQAPAADFVALTPTVLWHENMQFVETSIGNATSFSWDFDSDGTADSTDRDPVWNYDWYGEYDVTLTVMIDGQSYSVTHPIQVVWDANQDELQPQPKLNLHIYPNPFVGVATINLVLDKADAAMVSIFNLKGELVQKLEDRELTKGSHILTWDGKLSGGLPAPSGLYIIQVKSGSQTETRKVMLIK